MILWAFLVPAFTAKCQRPTIEKNFTVFGWTYRGGNNYLEYPHESISHLTGWLEGNLTEAINFLHTKNIRVQETFNMIFFLLVKKCWKAYREASSDGPKVGVDPRCNLPTASHQGLEAKSSTQLLRWNQLRCGGTNVHIRVEGQLREVNRRNCRRI